jgi:diacylglycerol kinase (CTP)
MAASQSQVPATPRVISPSPTPSEKIGKDGYFSNDTRPKSVRLNSVEPIEEHEDGNNTLEDPELSRARTRSRSPQIARILSRKDGITTTSSKLGANGAARQRKPEPLLKQQQQQPNGTTAEANNSFLSPADAYRDFGFGSSYWRNLSRSPSPLGLIPIHREWRAFVHKHEIPRKALHVSIGFVTLWLYHLGVQISAVHPILLTLLIPIATVDILRFRWSALNRTYIRYLGAFMRESEAHDRYNGVIMYLAGLWFTMRFCRKDVAVMSVLLLSWCDTAASTFGRLWGRYTPRIRKGKSLAGTIACFVVGVFAAVFFWGYVAPRTDGKYDRGENSFAFQGALTLPEPAREALGWSVKDSTITGLLAVAVMSLASGLIVSVSELMDVWELDDNLTIPVLSGLGLGAFLWAFGSV